MLKTLFDYLGYLSTAIVIVSTLGALALWLKGIWPVMVRLGNGLSKRRIAVLARSDAQTSLANLLLKSRLFKKQNILAVTTEKDLADVATASVILVYWPDWTQKIRDILQYKHQSAALIVYAPHSDARIPTDIMALLDMSTNVVVNNFRGRLLNDIVVSMITSGYEKE